MSPLTIQEQKDFGLAPAAVDKKLEGLLLAAEGIAMSTCPSAQNNERTYTDRMRFAIYTLARAVDANFAANPANNLVSESVEGYSYSRETIDYVGNGAVAGALRLVEFACQESHSSGVGLSVRGHKPKSCSSHCSGG